MTEEKTEIERSLTDDLLPSVERRKEGPYALCECHQRIPCNPCLTSCPTGAVSLDSINDTPEVDFDKCAGCKQCVSACPGLACFVIDETYSTDSALVTIPYEFLPLPEEGETVNGLDRKGNFVKEVTVKNIDSFSDNGKTKVITVIVPQEAVHQIRNIEIREENHG
ncbi:4Fe-4S dicluster domain-containing protein [Candidatus Bipolaricaulota bacterium]|nr:4Fe-4S dicluster domain-containing protein [Candidatus Bipolaricaulota bacterium]MBS3792617.1 4Fe-4S dicluster domain-containing protein [Candidatus Bipolaricaulota bacterium]